MTPDVIAVKTLPDYALLAQFATGEWRRLDMRAFLEYPAFAPLQNPAMFQRARVQHGTVVWADDIDISPDTLYLRGRVVRDGEQ